MRTRTTNRRGGLLLAGVAAVTLMGGSAFTASVNTDTTEKPAFTGYGTVTVSGGTLNTLSYTFSADKVYVETVELTFAEAPTGSTVEAELENTAGATTTGMVSCTDLEADGTYTCDVSSSTFKTSDLDKTHVAVTGTTAG